jgi:hypothetical protein
VPLLLIVTVLLGSGCSTSPRAAGVYAPDTRVLVRLDYDFDGDGRIDVRTYIREGRPVRLEGDADGDGVVDRWEYYGANGQLLRIGASSAHDGREDTWVRTSGAGRHVEISSLRDGIVDRREVYQGERLLAVELDTNHDGLFDMWEEFDGTAVARLLVDEEKRYGRPTRRLVYEPNGHVRVEAMERDDATR